MGIFDKIKSAIWGESNENQARPAVGEVHNPAMTASVSSKEPQPTATPTNATTPAASSPSATTSASSVDVAAILDQAVKTKGQKLDWRRSIVDLMKALGMDSSLSNRKELATELNYDGDTSDSAAMNMWLHKALMKRLAEHGGRVPPELID